MDYTEKLYTGQCLYETLFWSTQRNRLHYSTQLILSCQQLSPLTSGETLRTKELNRLTLTGYRVGQGEHISKFQEVCSLLFSLLPLSKHTLFSTVSSILCTFPLQGRNTSQLGGLKAIPVKTPHAANPQNIFQNPNKLYFYDPFIFCLFFKIPANNSLLLLGKLANSGPTASALPKSSLCSKVINHTDFFPYYWSQEPFSADCMKIMSQINPGISFFQLQHCPPQQRTLFTPQDRGALCPLFTSACLILASLGNTSAVALLPPTSL